jgi:hypothetical protein
VIGLTSDDVRVDAQITLRCAATALPVVSAERQPAMAVAILTAEQILSDLDTRPPDALRERSAQALADVPLAAQWARRFKYQRATTLRTFRRRSVPSVVSCAIIGIAQACIPDPDLILHDLLLGAIDDCRAYADQHPDAAERQAVIGVGVS